MKQSLSAHNTFQAKNTQEYYLKACHSHPATFHAPSGVTTSHRTSAAPPTLVAMTSPSAPPLTRGSKECLARSRRSTVGNEYVPLWCDIFLNNYTTTISDTLKTLHTHTQAGEQFSKETFDGKDRYEDEVEWITGVLDWAIRDNADFCKSFVSNVNGKLFFFLTRILLYTFTRVHSNLAVEIHGQPARKYFHLLPMTTRTEVCTCQSCPKSCPKSCPN